ncbi:hypothetical protein R1sor_011831 [Riccia sorocarpa]|uniref:Endonuclease/exonuclease/phosphatase domain-containing protein n=1 Tax=Riccia sorocarpa TaxID=122646 RepID=A0ABD3I205_9MARC
MKVLSWNTRGFGTERRRRIIRNFIRKQHKDVDIIALQELKVTDRYKLETRLRALMPEGRIIVDYTPSGRGGCALLISHKLRVSEVGTSQFGGAAWPTVHAASGSIRVASLHAPNTKEERQVNWDWWDHQIDGEDWLIAGDYNNVELHDDSKGSLVMIRGAEERMWRRLTYRTDMVDASSQKRWELTWGRLKQLLREEKAKMLTDSRELDDVRREVQDLRVRSETEELSGDAMQILKSKEAEVKQRELREAKMWKIKSKDRWLREDEAPSKYFYLQLKAKFSRERITTLERDTGEIITKHIDIISEVDDYYMLLYKRGIVSEQVLLARNEVVGNITRRINAEEDEMLHATPTPQEVDGVVENLPLGKSPGLDGITAEILHSCWSFVRSDCIEMVQEFWRRGALTEKTRTAVIKLLPKNSQTQLLKNWRPLSLMGLTYKILAKIMANRVKKAGINSGEIRGLQIDRNNQLVHRLFADDTGLFLQMEEDVFLEAKQKIHLFELASGALMNVQKSVVIPLGEREDRSVPHWIRHTGCTIVEPGSRFKYLGLLSGMDVTNNELKEQSGLATSFLKTWFKARKSLKWQPTTSTYPKDLTTKKLEFMMERYLSWDKADVISVLKTLKKAKYASGHDLHTTTTVRLSFIQFMEKTSITLVPRDRNLLASLDRQFPPPMARPIQLHESDGWKWEGPPLHIASTWSPPTQRLRALLQKDTEESPTLMARWGSNDSPTLEKQRSKNL